ncbi:TMV resistance protein N-like [Dorcoceras hygrometricum]|uniref:TMV resistance protein N-like n=1 Tax=Dorcoceras hygrometricum TaxID=472368 RepID=A0A2Z7ADQ5_9LAMI|nr:TMV resistance protein N-like [Dorcoceras hygrometricum]
MFELALDSFREALSSYTIHGGCIWLERDREVAVFGRVFVRAVFKNTELLQLKLNNRISYTYIELVGKTSWNEALALLAPSWFHYNAVRFDLRAALTKRNLPLLEQCMRLYDTMKICRGEYLLTVEIKGCLAPTSFTGKLALQRLAVEFSESCPRLESRLLRQSALEDLTNLSRMEYPPCSGRNKSDVKTGGGAWRDGGRRMGRAAERGGRSEGRHLASTCVTLNGSGIQLAVGSQQLRLRNHNFGLAHLIMIKRLEKSPHDPLGITDNACKNQSVVVTAQYGPFNTYIPIRSTIIGKSRVARDPITMHTSRRSNSDITCVTRVSMTFRVVRTNQYNQDLRLIHSTNGNHLESPNEGSSIDHQEVPDLCFLDFVVATMCGNCSSGAGEILRASGNTALSSPCWYLLATMRRVVNYHGSWFGQLQVELLMHLVFRVWCKDERFKKKSGSGSSGLVALVAVVLGQSFVASVEASIRQLSALAGSPQAAAPPHGRGGSSRGLSPQFLQPRVGETQFRPFQLPGSSINADVDFSRWCISAYLAVARDQLLRVISCWYFSCDDQQRALRDSEATAFCDQEPAVSFVGVFLSGYQNYVVLISWNDSVLSGALCTSCWL